VEETVYPIAGLPVGGAAPETLLLANRGHWGVEIMHRNNVVILGENGCANRVDHALATSFP
jgi:hypothetical protein